MPIYGSNNTLVNLLQLVREYDELAGGWLHAISCGFADGWLLRGLQGCANRVWLLQFRLCCTAVLSAYGFVREVITVSRCEISKLHLQKF